MVCFYYKTKNTKHCTILLLKIQILLTCLYQFKAGQIYTENGFYQGFLYKQPFMLETSITSSDYIKIKFPANILSSTDTMVGLDLNFQNDIFQFDPKT